MRGVLICGVLRDRFFMDKLDPGIDRIPLPIFRRLRAPVFFQGFNTAIKPSGTRSIIPRSFIVLIEVCILWLPWLLAPSIIISSEITP